MKPPNDIIKVTKFIKTKKDSFMNSPLFHKHLFWTNIGISVVLSGAGDFFIQRHETGHKNKVDNHKSTASQLSSSGVRWNPKRSCHMAVSFGLTSGFLCHFWYKFLDDKIQGNTIRLVTKKIILDQILFSPVLIAACLIVSGMIDKSSIADIKKEMINKGTQLYLAEWCVWPPAQFVNFYFLPTRLRVIYDNTISLGYDMYTSHVKNSP